MHLVHAQRPDRHVLEGERVCVALSALPDREELHPWAQRFSLLADPNRLSLLVCIAAAGPISVTDLSVAADLSDTAVSQALRLLRAAGIVKSVRDGRVVRYQLADARVEGLLGNLIRGGGHRHRRS